MPIGWRALRILPPALRAQILRRRGRSGAKSVERQISTYGHAAIGIRRWCAAGPRVGPVQLTEFRRLRATIGVYFDSCIGDSRANIAIAPLCPRMSESWGQPKQPYLPRASPISTFPDTKYVAQAHVGPIEKRDYGDNQTVTQVRPRSLAPAPWRSDEHSLSSCVCNRPAGVFRCRNRRSNVFPHTISAVFSRSTSNIRGSDPDHLRLEPRRTAQSPADRPGPRDRRKRCVPVVLLRRQWSCTRISLSKSPIQRRPSSDFGHLLALYQ